jgi:hypothetical protein
VPVVVVVVGALVVTLITLFLIILVVIVIVYRAEIVTVINSYCSIGVSGSSFCCSYRREHLSQAK